MYQIIAPTLFQNKVCRLPGIGTLSIRSHSAENDYVNAHIRSPFESIVFSPENEEEKGFNEFSAISELLQKNLDETGSFLLKGIGNFVKDVTGTIKFSPVLIDPVFIAPVSSDILVRQHASHTMLVGNQETTNVEMAGYFSEKTAAKEKWWIWAAALGLIGIGILAFYFSKHGLNAFGNVSY